MKRIIQFTESDESKALPILLRHSPGTILPNRTYVLEDAAVAALVAAGVAFAELSQSTDIPSLEGVGQGERI